jgi:hypothetical protein
MHLLAIETSCHQQTHAEKHSQLLIHCRIIAGLLPDYCRIIAGLPY